MEKMLCLEYDQTVKEAWYKLVGAEKAQSVEIVAAHLRTAREGRDYLPRMNLRE
jgi:hypothetical protein